MKEEIKAEALEQLIVDVKFGFEDVTDIFDGILDMFEGGTDIDEVWLKQTIKAAFERHNAESKGWIHPTDFEKLYDVFNELNKNKIIALHKAGYSAQEGYEDVNEVKEIVEEDGLQPIGYCFYHSEDLENAIEPDGSLYLAFGSMEQDDDKGIAIGNRIVALLKGKGFEVTWDGTMDTRIQINKIRWQKIYDDGLNWDMEGTVEVMLESNL